MKYKTTVLLCGGDITQYVVQKLRKYQRIETNG
jgi:hypothetical protein